MAANDMKLKDYLKVWFKTYHFQMMPPPVRAQWKDLQAEDDYDVVTAETQGLYRDFIRDTVAIGEIYAVTAQESNIDEARRLSGNPALNPGEVFDFAVTDTTTREQYLRVKSLKIGDRFYYNDLRSGGQKSWGDKKTGDLLDAFLPLISELKDTEQERFYRIIRTVLRNIDDSPPEFPDPDNPAKVASFLGKGKAFEVFEIQNVPGMTASRADGILKNFVTLVESNDILSTKLNEALSTRFGTDYTFDDFITDLKEDKIRPRALKRIPTLLNLIDSWQSDSSVSSTIKTAITSIFSSNKDMELLLEAVNQENEKIDPVKLAQFKDERVYGEILRSLYDSSKEGKRSAFFDQFANNNGTEITTPMSLVVQNFNYDKLDGKYKDNLGYWEQKRKNWGDWKEERVTKLWKRNLRHNYLEPAAKGVVDAICKLKISPKDGLAKILEKKPDIKKIVAQKSPASEKGFDFLIEVLERVNNSQGMKKAFSGALKNGAKTEAIAKEIIKSALSHQPPKVNEAKVALETLAVMRYDAFSSGAGKDVSKAISGINVLENTNIMKVPGVGVLLNMAQKGINLGLNATFWAGIWLRNTIQHSRGKISDKDAKLLQESMEKIEKNSKRFNTFESAEEELNRVKHAYKTFEDNQQAEINSYGAANVDEYIKKLEDEISDLEDKKNELEEELDSDANKGKYPGFIKEADDFLAGSGGFSEGASTELNIYISTLSSTALQVMDQTALVNGFKKYCATKAKGLSAAERSTKKGQVILLEQDIANKKNRLNNIRPNHIQLKAELNIAQDIYNFQLKKRNERAETKTPHNPGDAPLNEKQNAQMLAWFWNACNGYDFGLNINDYFFLKAHEHNPQKLQFNAAVKKRLENA